MTSYKRLSGSLELEKCVVSNNAQCMLTKSSSSRGKHEQYSREGRFGSAFCVSAFQNADSVLRKISMNAAQKCAFTIVVRA